MGCDIHLHVEQKVSGKWEHYNYPRIDRSYVLFGKMAGVRGEEKPISLPKGFPDDASYPTTLDYRRWGEDGHSHSWLNREELIELKAWFVSEYPEDLWRFYDVFGFFYGGGLEDPLEETPAEDVRVVFWFDN